MKRGFILLSVDIVNVPEGDRMVVGLDSGPAPGDGVVVVPLVQNFVSLPCNRQEIIRRCINETRMVKVSKKQFFSF